MGFKRGLTSHTEPLEEKQDGGAQIGRIMRRSESQRSCFLLFFFLRTRREAGNISAMERVVQRVEILEMFLNQ